VSSCYLFSPGLAGSFSTQEGLKPLLPVPGDQLRLLLGLVSRTVLSRCSWTAEGDFYWPIASRRRSTTLSLFFSAAGLLGYTFGRSLGSACLFRFSPSMFSVRVPPAALFWPPSIPASRVLQSSTRFELSSPPFVVRPSVLNLLFVPTHLSLAVPPLSTRGKT